MEYIHPPSRMLSEDDYYTASRLTQIVSVDLLIRDPKGRFLLGKRVNKPARGYWFNPGGRVFLTETVSDAAKRILKDEAGLKWEDATNTKFLGSYHHDYPDNFRDDKHGTHYISMAYIVDVPTPLPIGVSEKMKDQHSEDRWMHLSDLLKSDEVHPFVKYFFHYDAPNKVG